MMNDCATNPDDFLACMERGPLHEIDVFQSCTSDLGQHRDDVFRATVRSSLLESLNSPADHAPPAPPPTSSTSAWLGLFFGFVLFHAIVRAWRARKRHQSTALVLSPVIKRDPAPKED